MNYTYIEILYTFQWSIKPSHRPILVYYDDGQYGGLKFFFIKGGITTFYLSFSSLNAFNKYLETTNCRFLCLTLMAHVILAKRSSLTIISLQLLIVPKPFLRPVKLTFEPRLNWHGKKVVNVLLLSTKGSNHVQPIVLWSLPFIPHILTHILRSLTTAARNVFSACLSHNASNWWLH